MRTRRLTACLAAFGATAVVLAGCSSSPEKGDEAAEQESPLSQYMSAVYGGDLSPEEQQAQFDEQNRKVEELVADCMQEEGFEYVPNVQSSSFGTGTGTEYEYEPDDRDWVSQYGYGAVNYPGRDDVPEDTGEEYVDPNQDYVSSLSESEQQAYNDSLWGAPPDDDELGEDGSYEYDWTTAGCYGAAQHEVYETDDPSQSEEFKPLFDAINEFYEGLADDPGMAELDAAWSACMDAAGHGGFATQSDAQNSIYDAQNEIWSAVPTDADGNTTGEPDQAAFDALGEKEVELALADLDCREETDYRAKAQDIQFDLEEQFIADHKTELEALKAAAEQD